MHDSPLDAADLERARRQGWHSGADSFEQAANCPYKHDAYALRERWMWGFGEGRKELLRMGTLAAELAPASDAL